MAAKKTRFLGILLFIFFTAAVWAQDWNLSQIDVSEAIISIAGPRHLYVPAWELSLHTAQDIGSRLAQQQPEFRRIDRPAEAQLMSATVTPADALKLLEFVILAIEARRKDWLKDLAFDLDVGEPAMWALPQKAFG